MIWLTGLLTTLLVLASDFAAPSPVENAGLHTLTGLIFLLMAPAFAVVQSFVTSRRWKGREILEHRAEFLHRSLLGSNLIIWLFGCVALLAIAKWPQLIRENWNLKQVPLLDELALALPMLGSVLLSWIVIFDAERAIGRNSGSAGFNRAGLATQRIRTFSGLVLVPIALLFLSRDVLEMLYPAGLSPLVTCLSFIVFLVVLLAIYPVLLSLTWKTAQVKCPGLTLKLQQAARESGLPNEQFRVWDTDNTITNAVVVGIVPGLRRVFLSDHLLEKFEQDEVVAIYRHELGHLVYNHLHMRIAIVLVPLMALAAMAVSSGDSALANDYTTNGIQTLVWMLAIMAFMVYASRVVTRFVRKSEIQADLFAICKADGNVCMRRANSYCQALLKMGAISPELYERSTSAHPSIQLRVEVIRQVLNRPERIQQYNQRFRQEQQIAAVCLVGLVVIAVLVGKLL